MNFNGQIKGEVWGVLMLRGEEKKISSSHMAQRKSSGGISNILPFSGGRLFAKDTEKFMTRSEHQYEAGIHVERAL